MRAQSVLGIVTGLVGGLSTAAGAQVFQPWGDPAPRAVSLDVFRPAFDGGGTSTFTTINQIGLRFSTGSMVVVAELPIVLAKVDGAQSGATLIGNPLLGVSSDPNRSFIGGLAVRIPVVSVSTLEKGFAQEVGVIGDFADLEAYAEDVLTIQGTAGYRYRTPEHLALRLAVRPTFMAPTGSNNADSELLLDYGVQVGYETSGYTAGMVFNGRAIVTEPGLSFGERTVHELLLGGSVIAGQWRPGVILRVPMDSELDNVLQPSIGIKLEVTF